MAGSQLKQLKAALKSNGLIGQSNGTKKDTRSSKHTARDREARAETLNGIREEFNRFDERINRTKRDYTVIQGGKFVRAGSSEHNRAAKLKGTVEKSLASQYSARQLVKNKSGGLLDRRFGAKAGKNLTEEEIMLERFTRERQQSSKSKRSVFALGSDDEDDDNDDGFVLTHSGKALASEEARGLELDEDALGSGDKRYVDEGEEAELNQPPRKKSKKEVMQEIIAKSKFHKRQRQAAFEKTQEDIGDLDDDFTDVMQEINGAISKTVKAPAFLNKTPEELEYDNQVRELTYDRRAVPADRTKTDEEIQNEREEKRKKLEQDRLNRMNGMVEREDAEADDLDDDFWAGSEDEVEGFTIKEDGDKASENDEDDDGSDNEDLKTSRTSIRSKVNAISMPLDYEQFAEQLQLLKNSTEEESFVKKVVQQYQPHLAQGNKEKMNNFVTVLYRHCLTMPKNLDVYFCLVKNLLEKYNEALVNFIRHDINGEIHKRIQANGSLRGFDLINFTLIGMLFSTSDHYHLVVTPTLIIMNEILTHFNTKNELTLNEIGQGIYIVELLFKYQKLSKRYIPETTRFIERAFIYLCPEITKIKVTDLVSVNKIPSTVHATNISKSTKYTDSIVPSVLSVLVITGKTISVKDNGVKFALLAKTLGLAKEVVGLYRELLIFFELSLVIKVFTSHLLHYYPNWTELVKFHQVIDKVVHNTTRHKLALQQHRLLAIATFAPKFEENFNPDRKSYDLDVQKQEVSKMQRQLKKEKKETLKDLRRVTRFEARQQIEEKKSMYDAYHKKMHDIVALILTHEGAEKNQYEREKKERKNRK